MNVVIYDGNCGFCQYWIRWLLRHDDKEQLMFSDQYSEFFQTLSVKTTESVMLVTDSNIETESEAVLHMMQIIGYRRTAALGRLIPGIFRDMLYHIVARYRHHLAPTTCEIMPDVYKKRFIG